MKSFMPGQMGHLLSELVKEAGYIRHCSADHMMCFQKPLYDLQFPCFHLLLHQSDHYLEMDLHLDQNHLQHIGHQKLEIIKDGPKLQDEIHKLNKLFNGEEIMGHVAHAERVTSVFSNLGKVEAAGL